VVVALLARTATAAVDGGMSPPAPRKASTVDAELKDAKAINRGGAAGLIRAGGQIASVDLVDIATHARQATLTAAERKQLAAVVRRGAVSGSSSPTGSPWDSVYLIHTRSLGLYVAQLWDDQVLTVEVPDQLTKPDPPGRFTVARKRGEILISDYDAFVALRKVLEQKLGQPTKEEFRPVDLSRIPVTPEIKQAQERQEQERREQERRQQSRPQDPPKEKR
jgi:hypothetical protein